jgi:hypothetical protein
MLHFAADAVALDQPHLQAITSRSGSLAESDEHVEATSGRKFRSAFFVATRGSNTLAMISLGTKWPELDHSLLISGGQLAAARA